MVDNDGGSGLDLLTKVRNDIAREIGEMDPNDPVRPERVKELCAITEFSKSIKTERNKLIYRKWTRSRARLGH